MSTRDYKRGASDAMSAYEGHERKQETAARFVQGQIRDVGEKVDRVSDMIGDVVDYISDLEKANLYKLNTPVDIADLEETEQRVLLAVLYQLSADGDDGTEAQQGYIRAVQQYLGITNPQTSISLDAVENIEDIAAQKAIFQVVMEFFYLGSHPKTYTEDQMDFLDYFSVNKKSRREIVSNIEAIIKVTGLQGLMEKYGFVPQEMSENESMEAGSITVEVPKTEIFITKPLAAGKRDIVYQDKIIHLDTSKIEVSQNMLFKNCTITFKTTNPNGFIPDFLLSTSDSKKMEFEGCIFTTTGRGKQEFSFRGGECKFVDCSFEKAYYSYSCNIQSIENCTFVDCEKIWTLGAEFKNCKFSKNGPISLLGGSVDKCEFTRNNSIEFKCDVSDCEFSDMSCDKDNRIRLAPGNSIKSCVFSDIEVREQGFLIVTEIEGQFPSKSHVSNCCFRDCRTTRYDRKLVICTRDTGILFSKKVELDSLERATCTGLDDVIHI